MMCCSYPACTHFGRRGTECAALVAVIQQSLVETFTPFAGDNNGIIARGFHDDVVAAGNGDVIACNDVTGGGGRDYGDDGRAKALLLTCTKCQHQQCACSVLSIPLKSKIICWRVCTGAYHIRVYVCAAGISHIKIYALLVIPHICAWCAAGGRRCLTTCGCVTSC